MPLKAFGIQLFLELPKKRGVFKLLKAVFGIRVSVEDEIEGMDTSEHGMRAYAQSAMDDNLVFEDLGPDNSETFAALKLKSKEAL